MKTVIKLIAVLLLAVGCSDSEVTRRIQIRLTDAPGEYDSVMVDIQGIEYHVSDGNNQSGWVTMNDVNTGVYNLLKLTNGTDTLLADTELTAGKISQIRLVLGSDNSVYIGEERFDLKTPSAQTSGLKLNLHDDILDGITYKILLDFDAARSVVEHGGSYSLKPVISVLSEALTGAITGVVNDVDGLPFDTRTIYGILDEDTTTTTTNTDGFFLLRNLEAGNYTIKYNADETLLDELELTTIESGVEVNVGEVTDMGVIEL